MDQKPTSQQLVRAAVAAAGGPTKFGLSQGIRPQAVSYWMTTGRVPVDRILPLCAAGANVVTPTQLLEAMTPVDGEKAAA